MRIIGGDLRRRTLAGPANPRDRTLLRPTSDRMREAIFNILAHGDYPDFEGAQVLDLFAGTGAMGIEALSRGAEKAIFVDNGREAQVILKQNITTLGLTARAQVVATDVMRFAGSGAGPYAFIFCDAPYEREMTRPTLDALMANDMLAKDGVIVVETGIDEDLDLPSGLAMTGQRHYGSGRIRILRVADPADRDM